jgi:hypothetical protein
MGCKLEEEFLNVTKKSGVEGSCVKRELGEVKFWPE